MGTRWSYGAVACYPTPKSLADKVEEYFDHCFVMKYNQRLGVDVPVEVETPTFAGLARYLGFGSRRELIAYKNERDEGYEAVINDAKLRLEEYLEQKLVYAKQPAGIIFSLKNNANWEDTQKKQITGDDNKPLLFTWATDAADVIDTEAKTPEKEGVLPPPERLLEGSIDGE